MQRQPACGPAATAILPNTMGNITMNAKYAYVPYNRGATIDSDAVTVYSAGTYPAGRLLVTIDGSDPCESRAATLDGRYAQRITRRQAEKAFGRDWVEQARENADLDQGTSEYRVDTI